MKMKPQDPVFEIEDDEFLSEVAAMEADALSNKRRKVTTVAAANSGMKSKEEVDGLYMAALKGSKSVLVSQRIVASDSRRGTVANGRVKVVSAAGGNDDAFVGGGGGGGSCFKCGKLGHWARDCMEMGGGGGYNGNSGNDATVAEKPCPCGLGACLVLTANTEKNRGRKFYKCPMKEENGACGFFEWCDNASGANYMTSGHQNHGSNSSLPDIPCPCGAGSCLILTAKTGNNVGQQFYRCPANQGSSCGYFKWCTEQTLAGAKSVNAYKSSNYVSATNKTNYGVGTGSTCFKCGKLGHWAKDCSVPSSNSPAELGGRSGSSGTCFKCNESGHWARDCSSS